jgi:trans-aconitate methyltransferase
MVSTFVPKGKVLGVDTSYAMTEFASKVFPKSEFPNLHFSDIKEIEISENFDVITSFCVFQLVPNPREVFAKLFEITKPQGKLVMTFPIGTNPAFTKAAKEALSARGLARPPASPDAPAMRNPAQLREILEEAGYKIEKLEQVHIRYPFSSKEELIHWCEGTLTGNWRIPDEIRREFFEEVVSLYCQYAPEECEEDGFVHFQLDRIDVLAVK